MEQMGEIIDITKIIEVRQAIEILEKSDDLHIRIMSAMSEGFVKELDRKILEESNFFADFNK